MTPNPDNQIFSFESPDNSPGFLLWQVSNLWQRKMNAGLSSLGLTHVQFILLAGIVWLSQTKETITQAKLANHAKTDIMMTSKVLRALEKRGLVKRETDARDTRAKSLAITSEGYNLTLEAIKIVENIDTDFFNPIQEKVGDLNGYLLCVLGRAPLEEMGDGRVTQGESGEGGEWEIGREEDK